MDDLYENARVAGNGLGAFDDTDTNPLSPIKRDGSYNGIANGQHNISVGGYVARSARNASAETPARYSSAVSNSKSAASARLGPDLSSVSDDSLVHYGVLASGTRSGSCSPLDGTSVATPIAAKKVADDKLFTRTQVQTASTPHVSGMLSKRRVGEGKLPPATPKPHRRRFD